MKTATNPETGEKAVFLDGKWQVYSQSATNESGDKAFKVGDRWVTQKAPKQIDPREYNPFSLKNLVGAAVEPGLAMGTSGIAAGIGGWGAIDSFLRNELIARGMEGEITDPVKTAEKAMMDYSYQPRTRGGQIATDVITAPFGKYAQVAKELADKAQATTGSPLYGAGTEAMLHAIPMALAPKAVSGRPIAPKVNEAIAAVPRKAGQAVRATTEMIANRLPGGRDRVVTEMLRDVAGPRVGQVKTAIKNAPPGYTAGQAAVPAKSAEFSALAKMAEEKLPSDFLNIRDAQQAQRVGDLRSIAQSPQKQAFMKNIRKGVSDKMYDAARKGQVPEQNVSKIINSIDKTMSENPGNPRLLSELRKAKRGLVDAEGNPRISAQEVLSTVDGLRVSLDAQGVAPIKGQLNQLKKDIVGLSDKYTEAQRFYAETSRPITQMEIGQELIDTITPRMGSQERATAYANAVKNQALTMKKAAGKKPIKGEFEAAMTKPQTEIISRIGKELDTNADYKSQAMAGRKKMNEIVGTMWDMPKARVLERTMVILNTILKRIEGRNASATLEYFAELSKPENRPQLLKILEKATPEEKAVLLEASKIRDKAITAVMVGGAEQENR